MIHIRRPEEIERIGESCRIVAEALDLAASMAVPGALTGDIDRKLEDLIRDRGAEPSFLGYRGYPASTCISVNEQVVHGIPGDRELIEGDIVGIDVGACKSGYHGDSARTFGVGTISDVAARLLRVTLEALLAGIGAARPGARLGAISNAVQSRAEEAGFSVVRDLVGHGIGRKLHEEPQIPNYGPADAGPILREGMVLAIEPMVNSGAYAVRVMEDEWTVVTFDGSLSAHFEHTIVVTREGARILTGSRAG